MRVLPEVPMEMAAVICGHGGVSTGPQRLPSLSHLPRLICGAAPELSGTVPARPAVTAGAVTRALISLSGRRAERDWLTAHRQSVRPWPAPGAATCFSARPA